MSRKNWMVAGALLVLLAVVGVAGIAACNCDSEGNCYESVVVSGATHTAVNGTYVYSRMINDRPSFSMGDHILWCNSYNDQWYIYGVTSRHTYSNPSSSWTPPNGGWVSENGMYEDVSISGLEQEAAVGNGGDVVFMDEAGGRPRFERTGGGYYIQVVWGLAIHEGWTVHLNFFNGSVAWWINSSSSMTPPSLGWELHPDSVTYYPETVDWGIPTVSGGSWVPDNDTPPTLSGGTECGNVNPPPPVIINPTGDAGPGAILDVIVPVLEGEEPPMVGELPLAAIHEVGNVVTGSLQLVDDAGNPAVDCYIRVYLYSVDIATRPETIVLLDHWTADFNWSTREYDLAVNTSGLAPGYYDLRLVCCDGSAQTLRIELLPAED